MNYKEKYYRWLANTNVDQSTKKELESLPEKEIEERFYCDLEFGTGGLRGVMEAGSNRINVYTIRKTLQRKVLRMKLPTLVMMQKRKVLLLHSIRETTQSFLLRKLRKCCVQTE